MKLKIWNIIDGISRGHYFICAKTRKHAIELLEQINWGYSKYYFDQHAIKGCWGVDMQDVTPEVGVWVTDDRGKNRQRLI